VSVFRRKVRPPGLAATRIAVARNVNDANDVASFIAYYGRNAKLSVMRRKLSLMLG
jgi:hypothetical protein